MSSIEMFCDGYERLADVEWDFSDAFQAQLSSIHPYPARFINDIPNNLIEIIGCKDGTVILDPFCGSGTTLVEAQRHNIKSIGIDLNPIACLISKVKTTPLNDSFLKIIGDVALTAKALLYKGVAVPCIPNIDHWFEKDIQEAVAALLHVIMQEDDDAMRDALRKIQGHKQVHCIYE